MVSLQHLVFKYIVVPYRSPEVATLVSWEVSKLRELTPKSILADREDAALLITLNLE